MPFFFNPLCGFPLKRGAKGVAIFDFVVAITFTFIIFYKLDGDLITSDDVEFISDLNFKQLMSETHQEQVNEIYQKLTKSHDEDEIIIISLIGLAILVSDFCLSVKLWRASNSENTKGLLVWMGVRSLYIALSISVRVFYLIHSDSESVVTWTGLVSNLLQIFGIVVVNEWRKEILATGPAERI
ncbi:unnamed protein product [Orchesella dallaii]|uniref:Uncharacterized protein n=1 Tax=Orchesella dallaii TaxID=48710 RepID=A0ABP1RJ70_9HEXA